MVNIFRFELARNLSLALFLLALAVPARAALVFSDSFDLDEPPGTSILNYTGFANWDITAGAIDLIGHGGFGIACQSIACVDMDGTSGAAGTLATKATFGAGSYTIRFDISGNQRNGNGGTDSLTVTFGDLTIRIRRLSAARPSASAARRLSSITRGRTAAATISSASSWTMCLWTIP